MARVIDGARNKKKRKFEEKKRNPYKTGGRFRGTEVKETENKSENVTNLKKKKNKRKK